jgi:hypothetical protein
MTVAGGGGGCPFSLASSYLSTCYRPCGSRGRTVRSFIGRNRHVYALTSGSRMKLSAWAKKQGISYTTAWRWFRDGRLPVRAEQVATGPSSSTKTRRRPLPSLSTRVFPVLTAQLGRLSEYASREKLIVSHSVAEIGSGLNSHRPKLMKLLKNNDVSAIVVRTGRAAIRAAGTARRGDFHEPRDIQEHSRPLATVRS